jgi:hypothetical protein
MTLDEQFQRVATFGFTPRQTGFLLLVLRHSGVCLARQYCAYAGIARGQKTHDFFGRLVARQLATPYDCAHRQGKVYHLHHKSLYRAIGEPETRLRRPTTLGRAVERLMVLDHLVAHHQLTWLATEREKVQHFDVRGDVTRDELPSVTFRRGSATTTRFFPDRLPIGVYDDETHVFVYLAVQDVPLDFRGYLHRHGELLRRLRKWHVRLIVPRHLSASIPEYERAFWEELSQPLRPEVADEVRWYFEQLRSGGARSGERFRAARRDFGAARFRALYRAWQEHGDRVLYAATSPVTADTIGRGEGRLECQLAAHHYLHLAPLVGTA